MLRTLSFWLITIPIISISLHLIQVKNGKFDFKNSVKLFTINIGMLNLPVYLYTPAIRVFIDLDNLTNLGVDDMYHGYATIAKGIKNTIRFNFVNGEQRATNINGMTFRFHMFDPYTNIPLIAKNVTVLDDTVVKTTSSAQALVGPTITFADTTGITIGQSVSGTGIKKNTTVVSKTGTTVTLSIDTLNVVAQNTPITFVTRELKGATDLVLDSLETLEINPGKYTYSIVQVDTVNNILSPVFVDGAKTMSGNIELTEGILPKPIPSVTHNFNTKPNNVFEIGYFAADRIGAGYSNLHTYSVHYNQFSGVMNLWASMANTAPANLGLGVVIKRVNALQLKVQGFNANDTQIVTTYIGNNKQNIQLVAGNKIRFTLTSAVDLTITDYPSFKFQLGNEIKYADVVRSDNLTPLVTKVVKFEYVIQQSDNTLAAIQTFADSITETNGTFEDVRSGATPTLIIGLASIGVRATGDEINSTIAGLPTPVGTTVDDSATTPLPPGVFNFYGFDYTPVSGTIDKVIYRS